MTPLHPTSGFVSRVVLGLALFGSVAFAQTPAVEPAETCACAASTGPGLLGKCYVEASAHALDFNNTSFTEHGVGVAVNMPLAPRLDVGAIFEHTWEEGSLDENYQDLSAYATVYTEVGDLRPYVRAELGYEWWPVSDDPFYAVEVGAEYLIGERLSLSAGVEWSEYLASDWNGGGFAANVRANLWLTDSLAGVVGVTGIEGGSWLYRLGAVYAF